MHVVPVKIAGLHVMLDRHAAYSLNIILTELHGRISTEVGESGDMEVSTALAESLTNILAVCNEIDGVCELFDLDERNPV